jgi:ganglioside-induced differentiation-associated protein 1
MLTLYHHGSSACAAKVRFALAEKKLVWESRYIDILRGEQFAPEFTALNPKAVVPVLVHDRFVLAESTVICEYVEEVFSGNPIYPADPRARARVRLWTKAVDEELHPACSALTYVVSHRHTILRHGVGSFDDFLKQGATEGVAARTRKWQWLQLGLEAPGAAEKIRLYQSYLYKMEAALRQSEWLVGESFSMADVALAPYLNRLAALGLDRMWARPDLARVGNWFERIQSRPTFHAAIVEWVPAELAAEMLENGERSWPDIEKVLSRRQ